MSGFGTGKRERRRRMTDIPLAGGLTADGDAMLILATAYLLYRQNADMALILALLSVML